MKKFYDLIYYRTAASIFSTIAKGGTYPNYTVSGFTLLPGGKAEVKSGVEPDGDALADGGSTTATTGEKAPLEIMVNDFSAANFATIRSAFKNQKVDILLMDSDQPALAVAVFGTRLYPQPDFSSGKEATITLKGDRKYGSGVSNEPFQLVAIT
jgi:hypothetical protein